MMFANPRLLIICLLTPIAALAGDAPEGEWDGQRVARRGNPKLFGEDYGSGKPARYDFMTVYKPQDGGINGRCGGGGGTAAMDPCKHFMSDHLRSPDKVKCVVAATQRNGGSASVYGCVGDATTMNQRFGRPIKICFADVYAGSQDPHRLKGKKKGKSKFDVAVPNGKAGYALQAKITPEAPGQITCKGRTPGAQNAARQATRKPAATRPIRKRG